MIKIDFGNIPIVYDDSERVRKHSAAESNALDVEKLHSVAAQKLRLRDLVAKNADSKVFRLR